VVDPGVGTERRAIAVETESGYFLGPDNGLLAPAVAMIGGASRAVSLTNEDCHIASPGPTFAGRDILAPAAGYLARGASLDDLGEAIDPVGMMPGLVSLPNEEDGAIVGEVWWVDHFGNCQLNIDPAELRALGADVGGSVELRFGGQTRMARWVRTYADAKPSELVMLVDSYGLISIALDQRSASEELGLRGGSGIAVVPPPGPLTVGGAR
jgi:S-adenosylmethionine hydrolase